MKNTIKVLVTDLDGVLINSKHRQHRITEGFEAYFEEMELDTPNTALSCLLEPLSKTFRIAILTGRTEKVRERTELWLKSNDIYYDHLIMRPLDFEGRSADFKLSTLDDMSNEVDIVAVWEDNPLITGILSQAGYPVVPIYSGYYNAYDPAENVKW